MKSVFSDARFIIVTGNYGSGKTEISLNLALQLSGYGKITIVDLDIVNPYFRSGEKASFLEAAGIRVLMPTFAMTTVDIPALPAEIQSVFETDNGKVVFDVGGDDTGAAALGRYYPSFMQHRDRLLTVFAVNCMRPLTSSAEDIADLARRIENRGRLPIDLMINNTNFAGRTVPEMVMNGEKTVLEAAKILGVPNVCTCGEAEILSKCTLRTPSVPIKRYMVPEWMDDPE